MPTYGAQPRVPLHPVLTAIGARTMRDAERALGISYRTLMRYNKHGIPITNSDRIAILAGEHPLTLWGERWTDAWNEHEGHLTTQHFYAQLRKKWRLRRGH